MTRKWNIANDQSNANYNVGNAEAWKSNLCDYKHAYILARGDITIIGHQPTQVASKTCASFTKCTTKIDVTTIDDTEDLDLVISMYNPMEYSIVQTILIQQKVYGFIQKMN